MANMQKEKHPMPTLPPCERATHFGEVAVGYSEETAMLEAQRCLNCPTKPCVGGCPVGIDIPAFVGEVANGAFERAYAILTESTSLPAVCGRVCPQETQCEGVCVRGRKGEPVAIGRLERFVADWHCAHGSLSGDAPQKNGHKVAVIGSGPSGLACAADLAKWGYDVTVFEALHVAGGVLMYGIPAFRLPKEIVQEEIRSLERWGVHFETNVVIGRTITISELREEYAFEAIYIATGAGLPKFMGIAGEHLNGVCSANEFLTRINLMGAYEADSETPVHRARRVCVVGGGNVAMDAARCAKRLGAEVTLVYRRGREELPARQEEIAHAEEEGVQLMTLTNPVEILGYTNVEDPRDPRNGRVVAMRCVQMTLGEPDASGRRRPVVKEGSEFTIETDSVIMALGTSPNPLIRSTTEGLATEKWGGIITDETTATSLDGIFAGGDAVTGAATVILAMGAGRQGSKAIHAYIQNQSEN